MRFEFVVGEHQFDIKLSKKDSKNMRAFLRLASNMEM